MKNESVKPYILNGERVTKDEYNAFKFDSHLTRFPKGQKEKIQAHAAGRGESLNGFINRAIEEALEREQTKRDEP